MNAPAEQVKRTIDWVRPIRYLWRLPGLALHCLVALPVTVIVIISGRRRGDARGHARADAAINWWASTLLRVFGITSRHVGEPLADPVLFVANHTSWLDIEVIHSQRAVGFVGKAEIARWPIVGYLATLGGTVYHRRGSGQSGAQVSEAMTRRLRRGGSVAIFPEGRTGPGIPVLPFHGRMLRSAMDAGVMVQPVAIRFSRNGHFTRDLAFRVDEPFMVNFFRILGEPACDVDVHFLEPIDPSGLGRRDVAHRARREIAAVMEGNKAT
ncbi:MAG: lysophospholipid acyltransferase family protein [Xanthomonadales bacterium]|nr:lysophospholipid acyltransferase family protein [Xanthomonadales bacterium]